jgi:hypothetical protein
LQACEDFSLTEKGGIMRRALLFSLALPALASAAAPSYRAHMTGAQLIHDMMAEPGEGLNSFRRERAMGYIDGVADASAGLRWCPAGKPVPNELPYVVVEEMEKSARLDGDAAAQVLAVLGKLYPCRPGAAR